MMRRVILISSLLLMANTGFAAEKGAVENGSELFDKLCATCHVKEGKPTVAPPIFAVVTHVKRAYPDKEAFVQRIVDWAAEPKQENALMRGAIKKFGLMPTLGYADTDVRLIAEFLYDGNTELPEWYIEHYTEQHGSAPQQ